MDFEAFRKKKKEEKERAKKAAEEQNRPSISGKKMVWIEGVGPADVSNPKVKGFVQGRYKKQRVDPRTLDRPKGMQKLAKRTSASITRRVECCNENVDPEVALVICHGCRKLYHPQCLMDSDEGVCCEGKAVILAPPPRARSEKAIAAEVEAMGIHKPKGLQKY